MKKGSVVIVLFSIFIIIFLTMNYKKTSIEGFKSHESLNPIMTRGTLASDHWKMIFLDVKGDYLGEASLIRGVDGQYGIKDRESGEKDYLLYSVGASHKGEYLIVMGENHSREIDSIICIVEGRAYKINVPKGEHFIAHLSMAKKISFSGSGESI